MLSRWQRFLKHRWLVASGTQRTLAPDALQRLQDRVAASERAHSGEICIYVEAGLPVSYLRSRATIQQITRQRAIALFGKLRVWDTAHNNGVLIYLLLAEHAIELVADRGVNDRVTPAVWQAVVARMKAAFRQGQFEAGLAHAVDEVSALLVQHFPLAAGEVNRNELPDAPVVHSGSN